MNESLSWKIRPTVAPGRRRVVLGAASLIAIGTVAALGIVPVPAAGAGAGPTILVLGDSLSAEYGLARGSGWVALLEQRLGANGHRYTLVNASISGETTAGGRSRIEELVSRHKPKILIVELGGNDALRGLDLARTERNLREIAQIARAAGARVLLLGMMVPPNYGRQYADRFAGIFEKVARSEKAALVPFFLERIAQRIDLFQPDRIHPTAQAQPLLLDNVWPALQQLL